MDKKELLECIKLAEENPFDYDKNGLSGLTGKKIIALLRNFSGKILNDQVTYLEVGVFQGLSLLSVADRVPGIDVYGIDNFAFFDREGKNLNIINERIGRLNARNAKIINKDYEDALENLNKYTGSRKIGLYFVDGPHDYRSQLMSLMLIKPYLANNAVIVIDDSNYRHVRQANRDFLMTNPEFKLIFQAYTKAHPSNLKGEDRRDVEKGWWNGINVILKDSNNSFSPFYPPTLRDRILFESDHHLHTVRFPEAIKKYSGLINLIASLSGKNRFRKDLTGTFKTLNTYSDNLTRDNYNKSFFADNS